MPWFFSKPESVEPIHIEAAEPEEQKPAESSDCAWCKTGEGICTMHTALLFAQSAERKEKRTRA
jgi:hypothetical protein